MIRKARESYLISIANTLERRGRESVMGEVGPGVTASTYNEYVLMNSIKVLYLPEARFKLVIGYVLHPYAGCIVLVIASLVYGGDVNNRFVVK